MIRAIGLLIGFFCALGFIFGPSLLFPIPTLDPLDNPEIEHFVIQHTNGERVAAGLSPLTHDPIISDIARAHSENISRMGSRMILKAEDLQIGHYVLDTTVVLTMRMVHIPTGCQRISCNIP